MKASLRSSDFVSHARLANREPVPSSLQLHEQNSPSVKINGHATDIESVDSQCHRCRARALSLKMALAKLLPKETHVRPQACHGNHGYTIEPVGPLSQQRRHGRSDRGQCENM